MTVIPPVFDVPLPSFKKNSVLTERYPFDLEALHIPMLESLEWSDYVKIYYTVSGSYSHTVNGVKYKCDAGSAVLLFPFSLHAPDTSSTVFSDACIIKFSAIKYPKSFFPLTHELAAFDSYTLPCYIKFSDIEKELADNIFMNLSAEYSRKQDMRTQKLIEYLTEFFTLCSKHENLTISQHRLEALKMQATDIQKVSPYIDDHCKENISIDEICSILNLSRRSFTAKFKNVTGQTYHQYSSRVRANRAFRALRYTTKSVAEIALEYGYSSDTRFIHACKQIFGKSPLALKKYMMDYDRIYGDILNSNDRLNHSWKGIWSEEALYVNRAHAVPEY